jgi:putative peptidoglycan lipid II flippase
MTNNEAVAGKVVGIAPLVLLARGAGFLLIVVIARLFGATAIADSFFIAFSITVVLQFVITTGLGTVATPIMAELSVEQPHKLAGYASSIALFTALSAAFVALSIAMGLEPILSRLSLLEPGARDLAAWYAITLVPYAGLGAMCAVFKSTTEIRGRFHWAAIAPLARTGTAIVTLTLGFQVLGHLVLPLCFIVGAFMEVLLYLFVLTRAGCQPTLRLQHDALTARTLRGATPILIGQSLTAMIPLVDRLFAGSLDVGSVSALDYADRIRWIPQQFVEFTLVPVAFASWSHGIARGQKAAYSAQLLTSLRWVSTLAPPALMGLYIGRYAVIGLLFEHGEFGPADTIRCGDALGGYLPGLTFVMMGSLAIRAHIIEGNLRWLMVMGAAGLGLKTGLNWSLLSLGVGGLTLASSLTWFVIPSAHLWRLRHTLIEGNDLKPWISSLGLAVLCASFAGGWAQLIGCPERWNSPEVLPGLILWGVAQTLGIALVRRGGTS